MAHGTIGGRGPRRRRRRAPGPAVSLLTRRGALLEHVLWIGGPPGAGKTTVARRLARRHGLRRYASDAHSWEHRERAVRDGVPAAVRFEALTREQLRAAPVEDRLAMTLQRERGPMTIDDLRALPASPLIVAEGTQVLPGMLPPGSRAVWLLPSPRVRRARLGARRGARGVPEVYLKMGEEIAAELDESDAPRLVVDDLTVEQTVAEVERFFAKELAEGPRARTVQERRELLRWANLADVERYHAFYSRPWNRVRIEDAVRSFACECGHPECEAEVALPVLRFPPSRTSVLAEGHRASAAGAESGSGQRGW